MKLFSKLRTIARGGKWLATAMLKRCKGIFTNGYGMALLLAGIGVIVLSVGIALRIRILSLPEIAISAGGTFVGTFIITRALRRFSKSYFSNDSEALVKSEKARLDTVLELQNEKAKALRLEQDIKAATEKINSLEHRLSIFANVTEIQPACEMVVGKCNFDITDFYEEELSSEESEKPHLISKNYHMVKEFYRGVYERSGVLKLAVDLPRINVRENDREIFVYGPFTYNTSIDIKSDDKNWKMKGRREKEYWKGADKDDMELVAVKVTKLNDEKRSLQHEKDVRDKIKNLEIVNSVKPLSDNMVLGFLKLMLKQTGKEIKYIPELPETAPEGMLTLGEFINDFNRRVEEKLLAVDDRRRIE